MDDENLGESFSPLVKKIRELEIRLVVLSDGFFRCIEDHSERIKELEKSIPIKCSDCAGEKDIYGIKKIIQEST